MNEFLNITDIQRYSLHDGPGIRTTVFLKGCNLRCLWCHNPETQKEERQLMYLSGRCVRCGACAASCEWNAITLDEGIWEWNREKCVFCGECVRNCYSKALSLVGERKTLDELMKELEKDKILYAQDGGVTLSGGEPMLQAEMASRLAARLKAKGIQTAIDTAGNVPWKMFEKVLPVTEYFLYDVKVMDDNRHKQLTGCSNEQILKNLESLLKEKVGIWLRIPLIKGLNDHIDDIMAIRMFLENQQSLEMLEKIELLPYHAYGIHKAKGIFSPQKEYMPPDSAYMENYAELLRDLGVQVRVL